jgi:hypothetical protein
VFTGCLILSPQTRDEVSRLQAALPGYDVVVTSHSHAWRFEAVRCPGGPQAGPWCVVSSDLTDLWRELARWMRPAASSRIVPARAPDGRAGVLSARRPARACFARTARDPDPAPALIPGDH